MRFEVSRVLDAIERQLCIDPAITRGVLDLAEVARYTDLDGGRPATLLRLGLVIDALGRQLGEDGIAVYAVADRSMLSEQDLTSNERMVIRRWADDGLVDVLPQAGDRMLEVADMTGLPVLTRRDPRLSAAMYPWLDNDPSRLLAVMPGVGGAVLRAPAGVASPGPFSHPALSRRWQCPEPECAAFGPQRTAGQPPPRLRAGVPICPRHEHRLADGGPRPATVTLAVRVDGVVRQRFAVSPSGPVVIGRDPVEDGGIRLGPWLGGDAVREISRSHLAVALTAAGLEVVDTSTNGTLIRADSGDTQLGRGERAVLGDGDVVELHSGVELARPGRWRTGSSAPRSVMAEAPTVALKLPPP